MKPGIDGDLRRTFAKGTYRLVVLPAAVSARAVVSLDRLPQPLALPRARAARAAAREEGRRALDGARRGGRARPRPIHLHAAGARRREGGPHGGDGREAPRRSGAAAVSRSPPDASSTETLDAGKWILEAVSARRDSRVEYEVAVEPEPLVAGLARDVTAPAEVPVAIGEAGLYELASSGGRGRAGPASRLFRGARRAERRPERRLELRDHAAARARELHAPRRPGGDAECLVRRGAPAAREDGGAARSRSRSRASSRLDAASWRSRSTSPRGPFWTSRPRRRRASASASRARTSTLLAQDVGRTPRIAVPAFKAGLARLSLFSADGRGGKVRFSAKAAPDDRVERAPARERRHAPERHAPSSRSSVPASSASTPRCA